MVSQSELEAAIRERLDKVAALVVSDVSGGCGQAYNVIIVSEAFEGLNTLKRHRLVNDLLKDQIAQLHAFSQKTYTPQQYEQLTASPQPSEEAPAEKTTVVPAAGLASPVRPATLDTSVAQKGAKVHHRTTSSNVSVPELILTPDASESKGRGHSRQRSLTPNTHNTSDLGSSGMNSPSGASGISRRHYNQITNTDFWIDLRDALEKRFMTDDGSASPSASPGRQRGEAEMIKVFEDFFQTQKQHMSASDVARVRDGTGMYGM